MVSNYRGIILTYKQSVMSMIWLSWVTVEFVHRLCCYDNSNGIYLTTILRHFACVSVLVT